MKKVKRVILAVIAVAAIIVMVISGNHLFQFFQREKQTKDTAEKIKQVVEDPSASPEEMWKPDRETYQKMKDINQDYVFWLQWDSGLISEPVLQGESNQTYLRTDIYHNYDIYGTIFLDSQTSLTDDNLMLYGHSLAGDHQNRQKFSQLQNMTDQSFYEQNRTFRLYYEDHADSYEIVSAFLIDIYADDFHYEQNLFVDQAAKDAWISQAMSHSQITPVTTPASDDKFVTMQTCAQDYGGKRYVIIARKTGTDSL